LHYWQLKPQTLASSKLRNVTATLRDSREQVCMVLLPSPPCSAALLRWLPWHVTGQGNTQFGVVEGALVPFATLTLHQSLAVADTQCFSRCVG